MPTNPGNSIQRLNKWSSPRQPTVDPIEIMRCVCGVFFVGPVLCAELLFHNRGFYLLSFVRSFSINLFGSGVEFGFYDFYLILGTDLCHSCTAAYQNDLQIRQNTHTHTRARVCLHEVNIIRVPSLWHALQLASLPPPSLPPPPPPFATIFEVAQALAFTISFNWFHCALHLFVRRIWFSYRITYQIATISLRLTFSLSFSSFIWQRYWLCARAVSWEVGKKNVIAAQPSVNLPLSFSYFFFCRKSTTLSPEMVSPTFFSLFFIMISHILIV